VNLQNERQQEFLSLANSFNGMAEQVEQTISTLRSFVADAAHELHTPLTALQPNLELARYEKNSSVRNRYLAHAQEQGQRLEALVKSLLDLSRIEAAESKFDLTRIDLSQLVREVSEQFASRAEQTEHEFDVNLFADHVAVMGNQDQLRQVMINLLENALKFTPKDGHIDVAFETAENEVRLTITDTGIGIPSEDLPHLFERFHRGRNASHYAGNGLGLAIVKAIVTAHRGTVSVQSELRQGTQMIVSIPIFKED
jgi:signal transduction histidine kinase